MSIGEYFEVLEDSNGSPLPDVYVTVYADSAGTTEAILFTDTTGLSHAQNPARTSTLTDAQPGNLHLYLATGTYYGRIENGTTLFPIIVPLEAADLEAHVDAPDPHGDRAYGDLNLATHRNDMDGHKHREYTDGQLAAHINLSIPSTSDNADPHLDRSYARTKLALHVSAADPHGDRSYSDSQLGKHTAQRNPHQTQLNDILPGSDASATGTVLTKTASGYAFASGGNGSTAAVVSTPTGGVMAYAGSTAPSGFLLCHGSVVSRSVYANLYNVIGTRYGSGDGSSTFGLPDLRAKFTVGADGATYNLATKGGTTTHSHVTNGTAITVNQMPGHNHTASVNDPTHYHPVYDPGHNHSGSFNFDSSPVQHGTDARALAGAGGYGDQLIGPIGVSVGNSGTGVQVSGALTGITVGTGNTGGGAAHDHGSTQSSNHIPPYLVLNYIIAT